MAYQTETVQIELPLPEPALHAHAKGHWRGKAAAVKAARELAFAAALGATVDALDPVTQRWVNQRRLQRDLRWTTATLHYRFCFPDNRERDAVNYMHMCKAYIDGIVADAGLVVKDSWQHLEIGRIDCGIDRDNPRVVLMFKRRAG